MLAGVRIVDLTQPLGPATPPWPDGGLAFEAAVVSTVAADGSYSRRLTFDEHCGTHFDAPAHFAAEGATVEQVPAADLVVPAVVVDVRRACAENPDHAVPAATFERFEAEFGHIAARVAVLVLTGWDRHRADGARYVGDLRFPGLATDAGRLLVDRGVAGVGIDTLGIDPGREVDCPVHQITLPAGLWHLEGLVALDRLPATGAVIVVGVPPFVGSSGAPARVIALVP
jgi:kynurenine formamidase